MKHYKTASLGLCLTLAALLGGSAFAEDAEKLPPFAMPDARRYIEIGIDAGVGFANNMFSVKDILKKDVVLDLNEFTSTIPDKGGMISFAPLFAGFSISFNRYTYGRVKTLADVKKLKWGFSLFGGLDGGIYGTLGKDLFKFLSQGNVKNHNMEGNIAASGGIFAEAGLLVYTARNRWIFGVRPSVFFPVLYIPDSEVTWKLTTPSSGGMKLEVDGGIDVYSPFDLDNIDMSGLFSAAGVDLTLSAEYALFRWLNFGLTASHIPILASKLDYKRTYAPSEDFGLEISDVLSGNPTTTTDFDFGSTSSKGAAYSVRRPLTFDLYGKLLMGWKYLNLLVVPNIGFTAMTLSNGSFSFNWGVMGRLQLAFLYLHIGTGLKDALWRHRVGLALNFRAIEFSVEGTLQSQNFSQSFAAQGLGVNVGFRMGW
ncbi:MAG: hypothetical protein LBS86_04210 [Treponema sp.]|jgi:hypothetical protein|nr:hypothetical protein [Treponema sp.]